MATTKKHVHVLQHLMGFFKDRLTAPEKRELLGLVDDYAQGLVPLVVPITLVNHSVARFDLAYVRGQVYLRPHPKELMLREPTAPRPGRVPTFGLSWSRSRPPHWRNQPSRRPSGS